jgi:F-type H+-transporting ATPase subunit O
MLSARCGAVSAGLGRRSASSIALKYSNAAYSAALAKSPAVLNKVQTDLTNISNSIKGSPDVTSFMFNPTLSANERKARLSTLISKLEGAGPKKETLSDITKNLLAVLSENGRLGEAQGVIEGFNELVAKYKGELTVVVTSAAPLPRDVLARLEAILKQSQTAQQAKTLKITNKVSRRSTTEVGDTIDVNDQVNPSVLGGVIVDFGDKTIDLSVSSRVTKLNNALQRKCFP